MESSYSKSSQDAPHTKPVRKCKSCGMPAETTYVAFYENIGMLVMRKSKSIKGNLCKHCINYYFWNMTGKTMLLGWWGTISLFVTPFILLNNIFRFIFTFDMERPPLLVTPLPSLFWVFSTLGGVLLSGCLGLGLIFLRLPPPVSHSNDFALELASIPTKVPMPTRQIQYVMPSSVSVCQDWNEIPPQMAGSEVCACGYIEDYQQNEQTGQTFYYFGKKDELFIGINSLERSLVGQCYCIMGVVQLDSSGTPYIEPNNGFNACPY